MNKEFSHPGSDGLSDEDSARANFYALIGRLFYDAPDPGLLAELGGSGEFEPAPEEKPGLESAWTALRSACKSMLPEVVRNEYDALFIGVGKAQVTLYTSRYVSDTTSDKHLVQLREQLGSWGLGRRDRVFEVEDHVAGLCDVMRYLIVQNQPLSDQQLFFDHFVYPGVMPLCGAIEAAASAVFYRRVALFTRSFIELEKSAFEMPA